MLNKIIGTFVFLIISFSCVQQVDLDLGKSEDQVLIVEGQITNLNVNNYVRLTRTRSIKETSVRPVGDALITITSDSGEVDTLLKDKYLNADLFDGYYYSGKSIYKPFGTYSLVIELAGEKFTATSTMPSKPKIDSVKMESIAGQPGKYDGHLPLMYFKEPQIEKNYYMTKTCVDGTYGRRNPCSIPNSGWGFLLLDDTYLPSYISGININVPSMPKDNFVSNLYGEYLAVLYSLTPESYHYYQSLLNALKSDGGVYSPTPANHPTNIKSKSKVAGFFNVTSVASYPFNVPL
jgi:hypothetical protein